MKNPEATDRGMKDYLKGNYDYWQKGYEAENVESFVFRPYGRILKYEFGLDGSRHEKVLDWGCGAGAALRFYRSKGFDVYGADMSETDIALCRSRMPDIADHFQAVAPEPKKGRLFFGGGFDLVISIQSLYYLSDANFDVCIDSIYRSMKPGAVIYVSMIGVKHYLYGYSVEYGEGLRKVDFTLPRLQVKDYYVNFTESEEDLLHKFRLFKKKHIGYYDAKYREDEGPRFHYTFVGQKV